MTSDTDRELWRRLGEGELDCLGRLFDRHSAAVYNFAFRHTASWSTAEEVVQSTFVTTWQRADAKRLPTLDHDSALPWLLGVALNECRNAQRLRHRVERRRQRAGALEEPVHDHGDQLADQVAGRVDDERRMVAVHQAMAAIPPHERTTLELVVWSGLSVADAAIALGVAEGTVKSRLSRGRARLATALAPLAEELS